jgi:hypothetical protein
LTSVGNEWSVLDESEAAGKSNRRNAEHRASFLVVLRELRLRGSALADRRNSGGGWSASPANPANPAEIVVLRQFVILV